MFPEPADEEGVTGSGGPSQVAWLEDRQSEHPLLACGARALFCVAWVSALQVWTLGAPGGQPGRCFPTQVLPHLEPEQVDGSRCLSSGPSGPGCRA